MIDHPLDDSLFEDLHERARSGPLRMRELLSALVDRLGYRGRQSEFAALVGVDAANFSRWKNEKTIPEEVSLDRIVEAVAALGYHLDTGMLYASAEHTADLSAAQQTPDEYLVQLGRMVNTLPEHVRTAMISAIVAVVASILAVYRHDEPLRALRDLRGWLQSPSHDDDH